MARRNAPKGQQLRCVEERTGNRLGQSVNEEIFRASVLNLVNILSDNVAWITHHVSVSEHISRIMPIGIADVTISIDTGCSYFCMNIASLLYGFH